MALYDYPSELAIHIPVRSADGIAFAPHSVLRGSACGRSGSPPLKASTPAFFVPGVDRRIVETSTTVRVVETDP
jgi:hypothetical protein